MTQVNITLNEEELLQVLSGDREEGFKLLVQKLLNQVMLIESEEQLGASRYERSEDRNDSRNGIRSRQLTTRIGTITLSVPRHRNQPFHTMIFDNYKRSESALIAAMVQMVISGVSTRKVTKVVEALCGSSISKSSVSELCSMLDEEIESFRNRDLAYLESSFLMVDATYFKAREDHRIVSKAFHVATAIKNDGKKEIVGFAVYDNESNESWNDFLGNIRKRGLTQIHMVTSDSHPAILNAISHVYPDAAWQRCQFHFTRNILDAVPNTYKKGLQTELQEMFNCRTIEEARRARDAIIGDYSDIAEKAMEILDNGFEDSMTNLMLPQTMRKLLRTSNSMERMNLELKRRSNAIKIFPNAASILRLMGAVAIEYNDSLSMHARRFGKVTMKEFMEKSVPELILLAHLQDSLRRVA